MPSYRSTAVAVGVLFIVASATAIIGGSMLLPLTDSTSLTEVTASRGELVTGALIELILVLSVVGIAVLLFPVLRRAHEGLALAYVGTRMIEAVLLLAATISALVVLSLTEQADQAAAQPAATAALAAREWTYTLGSMVALGVSAMILNLLLYQARLVPAWLSLLGLLGGALVLITGLLEVYNVEYSTEIQALLVAPIALQEMVFAAWLIVKGFNLETLSRASEAGRSPTVAAAGPA